MSDNGDSARHARDDNDAANDDTGPVQVQDAAPPEPPPKRPFIAHNLRRFAPIVVLIWLAFLFIINTVVPQLEPVVDKNREALVPVDAP
jgi:hypothetical protein